MATWNKIRAAIRDRGPLPGGSSPEQIDFATKTANRMESLGFPSPTVVMAIGQGNLAFEWARNGVEASLTLVPGEDGEWWCEDAVEGKTA